MHHFYHLLFIQTNTMLKKLLASVIIFQMIGMIGRVQAQGVAINTSGSVADASASLDVNSKKGVLIPRLTTAERGQIASPATALLIFNKDSLRFQVNLGTPAAPIWTSIVTFDQLPTGGTGGGDGWQLTGNTGNPNDAFIGNKDSKPLSIKTNDMLRLFVDANSNKIGIGTSSPKATLDVSATDAIIVPVGTTAQRPSIPTVGMIRFNNTTNKLEGYTTNGWVALN
jgi:hypothetical protein